MKFAYVRWGCALLTLVCMLSMCNISMAWAVSNAEVDQWFAQQAKTIVVSRGAEAFPNMSAGEVNSLEIGAHIPVLKIRDKQSAAVEDFAGDAVYAAVVKSGNEPVGAVWADFSADKPSDLGAQGDAVLAAHIEGIASGQEEQDLIYDELLQAWFVLQDSSVMPADGAAEKIIAGIIPVKDFLIQRSRNLGVENPLHTQPPADEDPLGVQSQMGRPISPIAVIVTILAISLLLTVSLLWLRWESHREREHSQRVGSLGGGVVGLRSTSTSLNVTRVDSEKESSAPTLGKASGHVRVYSSAHADSEFHADDAQASSDGAEIPDNGAAPADNTVLPDSEEYR